VKRLSANDSADPRVKVGHRQAPSALNASPSGWGVFFRRLRSFEENAQKRATIQGFADRSGR
jgi:hypothetical protein